MDNFLLKLLLTWSPILVATVIFKSDINTWRAEVIYHNIGNGYYILGDGICTSIDPNPCLYIFSNPANNTPVNSFSIYSSPNQIPTNLGIGVMEGALYRN